MAFDVYPVGANSGFSEESAIDSEKDRLIASRLGRLQDFVADPFSGGDFGITTSGSSLDVDVAPGDAVMGGHRVVSDSTETLTVDASTTNYIWLVVRDAETGNAIIEYNTDGSTPSGLYAMELWRVTTDSSGVTGTTDRRPWVPYRDNDPNVSVSGKQSGTATFAIDSVGTVQNSVTFPNSYINGVDDIHLTLLNLDDTAVRFAYPPRVVPGTFGVDGFDYEVNITTAGASGTTGSLFWTARGR